MRWLFAVVMCYLACSVKALETEDKAPSLRILARSTAYSQGDTKVIYCKTEHIEEPIEWFSPAGKKVDGLTNNTRLYVNRNHNDLVPIIIQQIEISDSGRWTCKAGDFVDFIDISVLD